MHIPPETMPGNFFTTAQDYHPSKVGRKWVVGDRIQFYDSQEFVRVEPGMFFYAVGLEVGLYFGKNGNIKRSVPLHTARVLAYRDGVELKLVDAYKHLREKANGRV